MRNVFGYERVRNPRDRYVVDACPEPRTEVGCKVVRFSEQLFEPPAFLQTVGGEQKWEVAGVCCSEQWQVQLDEDVATSFSGARHASTSWVDADLRPARD